MTTTTPGHFACKKVPFEEPFNGGGVSVFASISHAAKSSSGGNGAAIWVESVNSKEFTACVLEYGEGSNGATEVNWLALHSIPVGSQLGSTSLNSWTTGTQCKRIVFKKVSRASFVFLIG